MSALLTEGSDDLYGADSGAIFSPGRTYRYRLWRQWRPGARLVYVMLNPSTADAERNDPTIERCQRRASMLGYTGIEVVNLFALRSPNPNALLTHPDPIGPDNDEAIRAACAGATTVICAWGSHRAVGVRADHVLRLVRETGRVAHYLMRNADGNPCHPLYQPYGCEPKAWPG